MHHTPQSSQRARQIEVWAVLLDDPPTTERLIAEIQRDGQIWCGATQWNGATAMRISVSSWKTTVEDARAAAQVIVECADRVAR